jgi:hypothetical protein
MFENNSSRHYADIQLALDKKKAIIRKEQAIAYLLEHPTRYKNVDKMINFFMRELEIL